MKRMLQVSVQDGDDVKLTFEFYNCGSSSVETGCPSLPNLMRPLTLESASSKDEILAQWHAHRPLKSVHPCNTEVCLEDISVALAFDVITTNDEGGVDNDQWPIVSVSGYCQKPWSLNVRGADTCTRHSNACRGRHLAGRLIFDLSYISNGATNNAQMHPFWRETYEDLWLMAAGQRQSRPHSGCSACAVYAQARKAEDEEIVVAREPSTPRANSSPLGDSASSDSTA